MTALDFSSMFLLGVLGTGHCLGMCGPLVVAIPGRTGRATSHLAYHLGRLITYTTIGAAVGAIGAGIRAMSGGADPLVQTVRLQTLMALVAATCLLYFGLSRFGVVREPKWMSGVIPEKFPGFGWARGRLGQGGVGSVFVFGLLMGFLPCGLSYAAFARVLPVGGAASAAAYVAVFALGTLPGLLALGLVAGQFFRKYRRLSDLLAGMLMIGMALSMGIDALLALS